MACFLIRFKLLWPLCSATKATVKTDTYWFTSVTFPSESFLRSWHMIVFYSGNFFLYSPFENNLREFSKKTWEERDSNRNPIGYQTTADIRIIKHFFLQTQNLRRTVQSDICMQYTGHFGGLKWPNDVFYSHYLWMSEMLRYPHIINQYWE